MIIIIFYFLFNLTEIFLIIIYQIFRFLQSKLLLFFVIFYDFSTSSNILTSYYPDRSYLKYVFIYLVQTFFRQFNFFSFDYD